MLNSINIHLLIPGGNSIDIDNPLKFSIDGISMSSIDYFGIEGRKCSVTCDMTDELKNYLVYNQYDGININKSRDKSGLYFDIYTTININGGWNLTGLISKESIKASIKDQTISFDIEDRISVFIAAQEGITKDMTIFDSTESTQYWVYTLLNNANNESTIGAFYPPMDDNLFIDPYYTYDDAGITQGITLDGPISEFVYPQVPLDEEIINPHDMSLAKISFSYIANTNLIIVEYRYINLNSRVFYDPITETYEPSVSGRYTTVIEKFNGTIKDFEGSSFNEDPIVEYGQTTDNPQQAGELALTLLTNKYNSYKGTYFDDFDNYTSVTDGDGDVYSIDINSDTSTILTNLENKVLYVGTTEINNLNLLQTDEMNIMELIQQLLFIINHTMYCKEDTIYIVPKYPNYIENLSTINITKEEVISDISYKRILFKKPNFTSNVSNWNISPALVENIENFYSNLMEDLNIKIEISIDLNDSIVPGRKVNIEGEGDCIVLSVKNDYVEQITELELIKES